MSSPRSSLLSLTVLGRFMLMVGTAAMIMLGGTGFAFYTFRTSLTAALGDPDKASAFLGPDAAASLDRLILGEMLEIALICLPVGLAFLGMAYVLAMGVKRPLKALQNGLDGLSQGDFKIEIAGADRGDEIGSIARSVAGFREKLAEKAVEDARQAMAQQEDMARQRADTLRQGAHDFETSVVSVVQRLSTAAQRGGLPKPRANPNPSPNPDPDPDPSPNPNPNQVSTEAQRAAYLSRVGEEPKEGEAGTAKICFHVGQTQTWRRFDSCSTLEERLLF